MSNKLSQDDTSLCTFTFADGRRCRMLRDTPRSKYCVFHLRKLRQLHEVEQITMDLFQPLSTGFVPANALAQSLSRLFARVAEGRIKAKDAIAMARIADTLLKTIPMATLEFRETYIPEYWMQLVRRSFGNLPAYQPRKSSRPTTLENDDNQSEPGHDSQHSDAPAD